MPINWIRFTSPDGTYKIGDSIGIRVNATNIGGGNALFRDHLRHSSVLLETGETDRHATFVGPGNSRTTLQYIDYAYTVREGDHSGDLDYQSTEALHWRHPTRNFDYMQSSTASTFDCVLPVRGTAGSLSYQSNIVVDGIRPNVTSVVAAVPDGLYGQGRDIRVNVTFGEPVLFNGSVSPPSLTLDFDGTNRVAEYVSGNNSATLVFNYTLLAGDGAARLGYNATNALTAAGLEDAAGNAANRTLFAPGSPGSLAHSSRLEADTVSPTVESVSSPDGARTYGQGQPIRVNVTFTERVDVVEAGGTPPYIELETGATDRRAEYYTGSGERSLLFRYMVDAGDRSDDLNYTGASALSNNGGTIRDAAGNDADLDLSGLPAGRTLAGSAALVVDGVAPEIASVTSPDDNDTYGTGTVVNITVGFTEPVEFDPVTARPEIPLDTGSAESRRAVCEPAAGYNSELECAYTVVAGDDTADLGYGAGSSLALGAGAAARDAAGNGLDQALPDLPATATLGGSKDIVLDTEVPEVLRVTSPNASAAPYDRGDALRIEVVFDGNVTIDPEPLPDDESVPTLRLDTGEIDRAAAYADGSGTSTLGFVYTVIAGDLSPDLNYTGADALTLGEGRELVDEYGNRNGSDPALPDPSSADSLGGRAAIVVRTVPIVVDVRANYTDASIRVGETVGIDVVFSEKVWVVPASGGGVPHIELATGRADRGLAVYSSGSGTDTLAFSYPVHHADDAARLDYAGAGALKNNSAQVRGVGMLGANLSLPERGPGGPLASANIRLQPNEAPSIGPLPDRTVGAGVELEVDVSATDPEGQPVAFSLAEPAPEGAEIDAATGLFTWTPTETQRTAAGGASSTYEITVRASDPYMASGTARFDVTVVEPPPAGYAGPAVAAVPPAEGREGEEIQFDMAVADARYGPYVYSLAADAIPPPPAGAVLHPNGTFSWTPGYDQNGTHSITARVADRFGINGTQAFTVTVLDAEPPGNEPPEFEPVGPQSADEGDRLVVRVSAADPDAPITYSLAGDPPAGAAIDPATGVFTWDIGYDAAGTHSINVSAADRYNRTSHLSFTVVVADAEQPNLPPEIAPIPPQRAAAGEAFELQVNATDPNEDDALAFALSGPRPQGAAMAAGGLFTWTPGRGQVGNHTLNVTVADAAGLSDWAPLAIAVYERVDMCSADLSRDEIAFDRIEVGGRSAAEAQEVRGTGELPLDSVSVSASAWTAVGGAEAMMPAGATSVRAGAGGDWMPLGGAPVPLQVDDSGRSAAAEFVVDVPQGALPDGAASAAVSQTVTYTVSCAAPPG